MFGRKRKAKAAPPEPTRILEARIPAGPLGSREGPEPLLVIGELDRVRRMPEQVTRERFTADVLGVHESLFRAYHILELAKALLRRGATPDVVLWVITECEEQLS